MKRESELKYVRCLSVPVNTTVHENGAEFQQMVCSSTAPEYNITFGEIDDRLERQLDDWETVSFIYNGTEVLVGFDLKSHISYEYDGNIRVAYAPKAGQTVEKDALILTSVSVSLFLRSGLTVSGEL